MEFTGSEIFWEKEALFFVLTFAILFKAKLGRSQIFQKSSFSLVESFLVCDDYFLQFIWWSNVLRCTYNFLSILTKLSSFKRTFVFLQSEKQDEIGQVLNWCKIIFTWSFVIESFKSLQFVLLSSINRRLIYFPCLFW